MEKIPVAELNSEVFLDKIKDHLENDGIIIYPTDTLYGIGCNFYSINAQENIDIIKGRKNSPYSVAISNIDHINKLISGSSSFFNAFAREESLAKTTFIFKLNKNIDNRLVKGSNFIGIRIPDHQLIKKLIEHLGFPIISTSVNISGLPSLSSQDEIEKLIKDSGFSDQVFFIDEGELPYSNGSTIIDVSGKKATIVRKGDDHLRISNFIKDNSNIINT